jgi:hypothetical protein
VAVVAAALLAGCAGIGGPVTVESIRTALERELGRPVNETASPAANAAPPKAEPDRSSDVAGRVRLRPRPRRGPFQMDLYRPGDHVPQFTSSWCVGSAMQMMINMMTPGRPDRSAATQRRLYQLARRVSPWVEERPGASTYGWGGGLQRLGHGGFVELASATRQGALRIAARQMRLTRRPVGLLVWEGRHAWVMSGFRATADPGFTDDFEVTAVWIEDPWHGRDSELWGPGLRPHSLVAVERLRGFVRWESRHRPEYGRRGKYTIVAPVA